jgi:hypothetical protein
LGRGGGDSITNIRHSLNVVRFDMGGGGQLDLAMLRTHCLSVGMEGFYVAPGMAVWVRPPHTTGLIIVKVIAIIAYAGWELGSSESVGVVVSRPSATLHWLWVWIDSMLEH